MHIRLTIITGPAAIGKSFIASAIAAGEFRKSVVLWDDGRRGEWIKDVNRAAANLNDQSGHILITTQAETATVKAEFIKSDLADGRFITRFITIADYQRIKQTRLFKKSLVKQVTGSRAIKVGRKRGNPSSSRA